ncbi:hypothetical protein B9Z55_003468 [Caenorhabditis nigoni]|nr:hypothetical protein B9Z55_003468 [Caenorhabditis nigoni]
MSDSSQSVQKSFEKSIGFGEKEPKEEVFTDDEPARKRSKTTGNSENFQDTSVISEISKKLEDSKNVIEEMELWVKKLEKLHDEDIDSLKKSMNDLAGNLKQEFAEKLEKIDKTDGIDSLKKSINDLAGILRQEFTEKAEEDREKLKQDFDEKIEEIKKTYQEKIDKCDQENAKIEKFHQGEFQKMKKYYKYQISKLQTAHEKKSEEFENFRKEMEISGKLSTSHDAGDTLYGEKSFVMSDDAKIPPTKSELEFLFKCIFCKSEDHKSIDCRVFDDFTKRQSILKRENRCIRCLEPQNMGKLIHICPRALVACSDCSWFPIDGRFDESDLHHPIVCRFHDQSSNREVDFVY